MKKLFAFLLLLTPAYAHSFYSNECCADNHCHPVPCGEVIDLGNGWKWRGREFTKAMLRPSPDGECHVCVAIDPICIYLPART